MEYCALGSLSDLMAVCQRTLTEKQIAAVMRMYASSTSVARSSCCC
jgi:hypothetical protein